MLGISFLTVPWNFVLNSKGLKLERPAGYHLIVSPPIPETPNDFFYGYPKLWWSSRVDVTRYVIQVFVLALVCISFLGFTGGLGIGYGKRSSNEIHATDPIDVLDPRIGYIRGIIGKDQLAELESLRKQLAELNKEKTEEIAARLDPVLTKIDEASKRQGEAKAKREGTDKQSPDQMIFIKSIDLLRNFIATSGQLGLEFRDVLRQRTNLTQVQADSVEVAFRKVVEGVTQEAKQKLVQSTLSRIENLNEKRGDKPARPIKLETLMDLSHAGLFTDQDFYEALTDAYGLPKLSVEEIQSQRFKFRQAVQSAVRYLEIAKHLITEHLVITWVVLTMISASIFYTTNGDGIGGLWFIGSIYLAILGERRKKKNAS